MKFAVFLGALAVLAAVCLIEAQPVSEAEEPWEVLPSPLVEEEPHIRQRRATCDLLSGFGVNHGACAAHCVLRGNRGGYCNGKAVCVCRRR
ncbi:sapecin [Scaptodrosophila lebanonensis]|uniref:Sapecin n=1 Tax=Drosophila lebanonensis TaxID=7225 RepID=A0A6J2TUW9_DROLE|nr:sapecin [Scaptodrosophila lebanonensis]